MTFIAYYYLRLRTQKRTEVIAEEIPLGSFRRLDLARHRASLASSSAAEETEDRCAIFVSWGIGGEERWIWLIFFDAFLMVYDILDGNIRFFFECKQVIKTKLENSYMLYYPVRNFNF